MFAEIEFGNDTNGNILFGVTGEVMRGRWSPASPSLRGMTSSAGMNQMPELPGMRLAVDSDDMVMTITDPLGEPENAGLLDEANRVLKGVFSTTSKAADKVVRELSQDEYKTLLYWMRRLLDSGDARTVSGSVPEMTTIRSSIAGQIRKAFWDTGANSDQAYEKDESDSAVAQPVAVSVGSKKNDIKVVDG